MSDPKSWDQATNPADETDTELAEVLRQLEVREPIFHRPEFGTTRSDFESMMAIDFWEIGASGHRYSKEEVLAVLEARHSGPQEDVWETSDFHCRRLSGDTFLLTYTLLQDRVRRTRRCTIWCRTSTGWKILYHQGTILQEAASL